MDFRTLMRPALMLFLLLAAIPATARVSWRSKAYTGHPSSRLGWERAYRSSVNVNGAEGEAMVFSSGKSMAGTLADLRGWFEARGEDARFFPGQQMAWGQAREPGWEHRFLILSLDQDRHCIVYQTTLDEKAAARSAKPDGRHRLKEAPAFPGSQATYYLHDRSARTQTETSTAGSSAQAVLDFYDSALPSAGWGATPASPRSMRIFIKGKYVLCLTARDGGAGKGTQITRMLLERKRNEK